MQFMHRPDSSALLVLRVTQHYKKGANCACQGWLRTSVASLFKPIDFGPHICCRCITEDGGRKCSNTSFCSTQIPIQLIPGGKVAWGRSWPLTSIYCCRGQEWWSYTATSPLKNKLHGLSPRANYTDRATAACRRSNCQLLWIEGATWSTWHPYGRILGFLGRSRYFNI
jgi:hypothetical protein